MGLFDRRKDNKAGPQPAPGQPDAPQSGPMPVASEVKEQRIRAEPTVAPDPPAPPAAPVPIAAEPTAEPGQPEPPPPSAQGVPEPVIHTITAGETLADLADRYGVAAEEVARQNHLPAGGQVHAGQVLVIRT